MRSTLIVLCLFMASCGGFPKGVVCVLGNSGLLCHDPEKNTDYTLPYPINVTDGSPPINFIAISPTYLQELEAYAKARCK